MIKVCMISKKEWLLANYWESCSPPAPPPPPPPVATALRSKKTKNIYDLRFVKCYPCECHDFVNQFILIIQLYYIFSV